MDIKETIRKLFKITKEQTHYHFDEIAIHTQWQAEVQESKKFLAPLMTSPNPRDKQTMEKLAELGGYLSMGLSEIHTPKQQNEIRNKFLASAVEHANKNENVNIVRAWNEGSENQQIAMVANIIGTAATIEKASRFRSGQWSDENLAACIPRDLQATLSNPSAPDLSSYEGFISQPHFSSVESQTKYDSSLQQRGLNRNTPRQSDDINAFDLVDASRSYSWPSPFAPGSEHSGLDNSQATIYKSPTWSTGTSNISAVPQRQQNDFGLPNLAALPGFTAGGVTHVVVENKHVRYTRRVQTEGTQQPNIEIQSHSTASEDSSRQTSWPNTSSHFNSYPQQPVETTIYSNASRLPTDTHLSSHPPYTQPHEANLPSLSAQGYRRSNYEQGENEGIRYARPIQTGHINPTPTKRSGTADSLFEANDIIDGYSVQSSPPLTATTTSSLKNSWESNSTFTRSGSASSLFGVNDVLDEFSISEEPSSLIEVPTYSINDNDDLNRTYYNPNGTLDHDTNNKIKDYLTDRRTAIYNDDGRFQFDAEEDLRELFANKSNKGAKKIELSGTFSIHQDSNGLSRIYYKPDGTLDHKANSQINDLVEKQNNAISSGDQIAENKLKAELQELHMTKTENGAKEIEQSSIFVTNKHDPLSRIYYNIDGTLDNKTNNQIKTLLEKRNSAILDGDELHHIQAEEDLQQLYGTKNKAGAREITEDNLLSRHIISQQSSGTALTYIVNNNNDLDRTYFKHGKVATQINDEIRRLIQDAPSQLGRFYGRFRVEGAKQIDIPHKNPALLSYPNNLSFESSRVASPSIASNAGDYRQRADSVVMPSSYNISVASPLTRADSHGSQSTVSSSFSSPFSEPYGGAEHLHDSATEYSPSVSPSPITPTSTNAFQWHDWQHASEYSPEIADNHQTPSAQKSTDDIYNSSPAIRHEPSLIPPDWSELRKDCQTHIKNYHQELLKKIATEQNVQKPPLSATPEIKKLEDLVPNGKQFRTQIFNVHNGYAVGVLTAPKGGKLVAFKADNFLMNNLHQINSAHGLRVGGEMKNGKAEINPKLSQSQSQGPGLSRSSSRKSIN